MKENLARAREKIRNRPELKDFEVHRDGKELHLRKAGESFARLIPAGETGEWEIEVFQNRESWEILDFSGSLEECLDFLIENPHYLFWNR